MDVRSQRGRQVFCDFVTLVCWPMPEDLYFLTWEIWYFQRSVPASWRQGNGNMQLPKRTAMPTWVMG